jgi:hypothetical protein
VIGVCLKSRVISSDNITPSGWRFCFILAECFIEQQRATHMHRRPKSHVTSAGTLLAECRRATQFAHSLRHLRLRCAALPPTSLRSRRETVPVCQRQGTCAEADSADARRFVNAARRCAQDHAVDMWRLKPKKEGQLSTRRDAANCVRLMASAAPNRDSVHRRKFSTIPSPCLSRETVLLS